MPSMALKKLLFLIAGTSVAAASIPEKIEKVDFRSLSRPVQHELEKSSPAVSALEDSRISFHTESNQEIKVFAELSTDFKAPDKIVQPKIIALKALHIASEPRAVTKKLRTSRSIDLAKNYLFEHPAPITMQEKAKELVAAAIQENQFIKKDTTSKEISTSAGSTIYVANNFAQTDQRVKPPRSLAKKPVSYDPTRTLLANNYTSPKLAKQPSLDIANDPAVIFGLDGGKEVSDGLTTNLEGLAVIPGNMSELLKVSELSVEQRYFGEQVSVGYFTKDNAFKLPIRSRLGEVVIQMRSKEGYLLASAEAPVSAVTGRAQFLLKEVEDQFELDIIASNDGAKPTEVIDLNIGFGFDQMSLDAKSTYNFLNDKILIPSTVFIQASAKKKYAATLQNFYSGIKNNLKMISIDEIDQLFLKLGFRKWSQLKDQATVSGTISRSGQKMSHAVVDLLFRKDESIKYISHKNVDAKMTDSSGRFLISNLKSGLEFIRVQQIGFTSFPMLIAVLESHITQLDINISKKQKVEVTTTELFTPNTLPSLGNIVGDEIVASSDSDGVLVIDGHFLNGTTLLEVDSGNEYLMTRISLDQHSRALTTSSLSRIWLNQLYETNALKPGLQTYVAGQVFGQEYKVSVQGEGLEYQVLYFNEDGTPISNASMGKANGAYLIAGLQPGMHTLKIQPKLSDKVILTQVLVDDRAVHFTNTNLNDF